MRVGVGVTVAILSSAAMADAAPAATGSCERLSALTLPATKIAMAQPVAAGAFTPPGGGKAIAGLPAFCRVAGTIRPSSDSEIQFEVWMPASGWNGRFQGIGNGGFAGAIDYSDLASAVKDGYAAAATDTGHPGSPINAQWALGHPEKIVDFGYRAIHETAQKAKAVIQSFYGRQARHSYFASCSNGGRQGLMEAQRYPADYDGIVAGAPANAWTHLAVELIWNAQALGTPGGFIPPTKLPAIERAVLASCDAGDGVKDDVVGDPMRCTVDFSTILCKGPESAECLTQNQVSTLEKIYSGPRTSTGASIFPGDVPGSETGGNGWGLWITGAVQGTSLQFIFGTEFMKNMVMNDPAWDYKSFNFDNDVKTVDARMGPILNATVTDLKPFHDLGGKLILYHGWSDAAIAPVNSINYYREVISTMGTAEADSFVRLYMVPGLQHCGGGPGATDFDLDSALEGWVESGKAPAGIVATKYVKPGDRLSGVVRSRPLCPYPQVARYTGSGSTDDAANFHCQAP